MINDDDDAAMDKKMDQSETSVGDSSSKEVKFEIMIKLEDDVETVHMDKDGTRKLKCP